MLLEYLFTFILGLVFGSFVSAVSWRIPKKLSFVKGRSICPNCKRKIPWYDNIPLLSFILLGGKCRYCKKRISPRYPIIELATGIGFSFIYFFLTTFKGYSLLGVYSILGLMNLVFLWIIFVVLLIIFVIDLENQIVPDSLVFAGIIIVLFYLLIYNPQSLFSAIFSGFLAASFLMLVHLFTKGNGMGLGDVKLAIFGGMFVGLKLLPLWFLVAFLTGALAGIILILLGRARMKTRIAFGPFLILGIYIVLVFGNNIIDRFGIL